MAQVKIEDIIGHLGAEVRQALEIAVAAVLPEAQFDGRDLLREFQKAVSRKCRTWERVPDRYVRIGDQP